MKIAFTGAGGTGKTTLATAVAEKWGVPYLTNTAREIMAELGIKNEEDQKRLTPKEILDFQLEIFRRLKKRRERMTSFVSDRLLLDNYTYGLLRCNDSLTEELRKTWEQEAIDDLYKMDLVFYVPAGYFPLKGDGIRQEGVAHQFLFDSAIYGLLSKHGFDRMAGHIYVLNMADHERRLKYIHSLISETFVKETL